MVEGTAISESSRANSIRSAIKNYDSVRLESLLNDLPEKDNFLNTEHCGETFLHCAVNTKPIILEYKFKYQIIILKLLKHRADPNQGNGKSVFHVAAKTGNDVALRTMLRFAVMADSDVAKNEMLTSFIVCRTEIMKDKNVADEIKDKIDQSFLSAIEFAAKHGTEDTVIKLLKETANFDIKFVKYSLRSIKKETFEKFLDDFITDDNKKSQHDVEYVMTLKYDFLAPREVRREYDDKGLAPEMAALRYISGNANLRASLAHPVIESFLLCKWYRAQAFVYTNLVLYSLFLILLNIHILTEHYGKHTFSTELSNKDNNVTFATLINTKSDGESYLSQKLIGARSTIVWILLTTFFIIFVLREICQVLISPISYITSAENYLEIGIIILMITNYCNYFDNVRVKHELSALTLAFAWFEYIILTGRLPMFSISFEMMRVVSKNLLKAMIYYSLFIISFASCFYIVFHDTFIRAEGYSNIVLDLLSSLIKTVVMVSGEFELAESIDLSVVPVMGHLLFVGFVLFISIVLLNLLNGMAVGDTREVHKEAKLHSLVSRVKLLSVLENILTGQYTSFLRISPIKDIYLALLLFPVLPNRSVDIHPNKHKWIKFNEGVYLKSRFSNWFSFNKSRYNIKMDSNILERAMEIQKSKNPSTTEDNSQLHEKVKHLTSEMAEMNKVLKGLLNHLALTKLTEQTSNI